MRSERSCGYGCGARAPFDRAVVVGGRNTVRRYIGAAVAAGWSAMAARVSSAMSCWATLEPDNGHPGYQGRKSSLRFEE